MTSFTVKPEGSVYVRPLSAKQEGDIAFVFKGKPMHCLPVYVVKEHNDELTVKDTEENAYSFSLVDNHWVLKSSLSPDSLLHGTTFVTHS